MNVHCLCGTVDNEGPNHDKNCRYYYPSKLSKSFELYYYYLTALHYTFRRFPELNPGDYVEVKHGMAIFFHEDKKVFLLVPNNIYQGAAASAAIPPFGGRYQTSTGKIMVWDNALHDFVEEKGPL